MPASHLILQPNDFSPTSAKAFEVACALARDRSARLLVLHVVPAPLTTLGGTPGLPPSELEYDLEAPRKQLAGLRAPKDVPLETRLLIGEAAETILSTARASGCELIVMGTHGRSGIGRLLMGSVAEQVIRRAPCPVLTLDRKSVV